MSKKDIFKAYQDKKNNKIKKISERINNTSSLFIYHKILTRIKRQVISFVRIHDVQVIREIEAKIENLREEISTIHAKNFNLQIEHKNTKREISNINKRINSLKIIITIYAKEVFYLALQDRIIECYQELNGQNDEYFNDYVKLWINKKIAFIHNAYAIKVGNEKIPLSENISNTDFLTRYNILS